MHYRRRFVQILMISSLAIAGAVAHAQTQIPSGHSRLYYRIGGSDPASRAANPSAVSLKLGLGGVAKLNYSCGKFDAGISFQNLMNGFANLGTTVANGVKAGISALPMYILQRAQPGLYELFQTYAKKAEISIAAALKSCEEMEAQIKSGGDPYEEWIKLAKGESWKVEANLGSDVVASKSNVESLNGRDGLTWIGGEKKGGFSQRPITVIKDLVTAGFNTTMGASVLASDTVTYTSTGPNATKLARSFPRAIDASVFATEVLGDIQIATCAETSCPNKGAQTGLGLLPKFEAEQGPALTQMSNLVSAGVPKHADLDAASAPGVSISREVVDAMREMPQVERSLAVSRLAREVALSRTIDKALTVRNLLLTGLTIPEANVPVAQNEARKKVEELNRYIDDLMFESRVRKEIVSNTASALLDAYRSTRSQSTTNGTQSLADPRPLTDGRVK